MKATFAEWHSASRTAFVSIARWTVLVSLAVVTIGLAGATFVTMVNIAGVTHVSAASAGTVLSRRVVVIPPVWMAVGWQTHLAAMSLPAN